MGDFIQTFPQNMFEQLFYFLEKICLQHNQNYVADILDFLGNKAQKCLCGIMLYEFIIQKSMAKQTNVKKLK